MQSVKSSDNQHWPLDKVFQLSMWPHPCLARVKYSEKWDRLLKYPKGLNDFENSKMS